MTLKMATLPDPTNLEDMDTDDLDQIYLNDYSPDFFKAFVIQVYGHEKINHENFEMIMIGDKNVLVLAGTSIDGGLDMPSLYKTYNLRKTKAIDYPAMYHTAFYEKIDPTLKAYAFYPPGSGASHDESYLTEII